MYSFMFIQYLLTISVCDPSCATCSGPGDRGCVECAEGYLDDNGACKGENTAVS